MLVEGTFDIEADGQPKIEGEKYDWSFDGKGVKDFDPNPSDDGKTKFNSKAITKVGKKSFIKVKYGGAEDKKEAKITRLNSVSLKDKNDAEVSRLSNAFIRGRNSVKILFAYTYQYLMYDQYKEFITTSEYGEPKAKVMLKESFTKFLEK